MKMTKKEIELHERVKGVEKDIQIILTNHLPHLKDNIDDTRQDLKGDIDNVKLELKKDIQSIKDEFIGQLKKLDWKFFVIAVALVLLVVDHADALMNFIKMIL